MSSRDFATSHLKETCRTLCEHVIFTEITEKSVEKLAKILRLELEAYAQSTRIFMESARRTQPSVLDVKSMFKMKRVNLKDVMDYAKNGAPKVMSKKLPLFPVPKDNILHTPPKSKKAPSTSEDVIILHEESEKSRIAKERQRKWNKAIYSDFIDYEKVDFGFSTDEDLDSDSEDVEDSGALLEENGHRDVTTMISEDLGLEISESEGENDSEESKDTEDVPTTTSEGVKILEVNSEEVLEDTRHREVTTTFEALGIEISESEGEDVPEESQNLESVENQKLISEDVEDSGAPLDEHGHQDVATTTSEDVKILETDSEEVLKKDGHQDVTMTLETLGLQMSESEKEEEEDVPAESEIPKTKKNQNLDSEDVVDSVALLEQYGYQDVTTTTSEDVKDLETDSENSEVPNILNLERLKSSKPEKSRREPRRSFRKRKLQVSKDSEMGNLKRARQEVQYPIQMTSKNSDLLKTPKTKLTLKISREALSKFTVIITKNQKNQKSQNSEDVLEETGSSESKNNQNLDSEDVEDSGALLEQYGYTESDSDDLKDLQGEYKIAFAEYKSLLERRKRTVASENVKILTADSEKLLEESGHQNVTTTLEAFGLQMSDSEEEEDAPAEFEIPKTKKDLDSKDVENCEATLDVTTTLKSLGLQMSESEGEEVPENSEIPETKENRILDSEGVEDSGVLLKEDVPTTTPEDVRDLETDSRSFTSSEFSTSNLEMSPWEFKKSKKSRWESPGSFRKGKLEVSKDSERVQKTSNSDPLEPPKLISTLKISCLSFSNSAVVAVKNQKTQKSEDVPEESLESKKNQNLDSEDVKDSGAPLKKDVTTTLEALGLQMSESEEEGVPEESKISEIKKNQNVDSKNVEDSGALPEESDVTTTTSGDAKNLETESKILTSSEFSTTLNQRRSPRNSQKSKKSRWETPRSFRKRKLEISKDSGRWEGDSRVPKKSNFDLLESPKLMMTLKLSRESLSNSTVIVNMNPKPKNSEDVPEESKFPKSKKDQNLDSEDVEGSGALLEGHRQQYFTTTTSKDVTNRETSSEFPTSEVPTTSNREKSPREIKKSKKSRWETPRTFRNRKLKISKDSGVQKTLENSGPLDSPKLITTLKISRQSSSSSTVVVTKNQKTQKSEDVPQESSESKNNQNMTSEDVEDSGELLKENVPTTIPEDVQTDSKTLTSSEFLTSNREMSPRKITKSKKSRWETPRTFRKRKMGFSKVQKTLKSSVLLESPKLISTLKISRLTFSNSTVVAAKKQKTQKSEVVPEESLESEKNQNLDLEDVKDSEVPQDVTTTLEALGLQMSESEEEGVPEESRISETKKNQNLESKNIEDSGTLPEESDVTTTTSEDVKNLKSLTSSEFSTSEVPTSSTLEMSPRKFNESEESKLRKRKLEVSKDSEGEEGDSGVQKMLESSALPGTPRRKLTLKISRELLSNSTVVITKNPKSQKSEDIPEESRTTKSKENQKLDSEDVGALLEEHEHQDVKNLKPDSGARRRRKSKNLTSSEHSSSKISTPVDQRKPFRCQKIFEDSEKKEPSKNDRKRRAPGPLESESSAKKPKKTKKKMKCPFLL